MPIDPRAMAMQQAIQQRGPQGMPQGPQGIPSMPPSPSPGPPPLEQVKMLLQKVMEILAQIR